jgi:hypothetical protein
MTLAKHLARWRSRLGTLDQLPFESNPYVYALNNPLLYIDPTGFAARKGGGGRKGPINPSTNDPGPDDMGVGTNGILCAFGVTQACLDPDLFVCTRWECFPKCGKSYFKEVPSKEVIFTDPDTPCKCVRQEINKNYDKPLPGL